MNKRSRLSISEATDRATDSCFVAMDFSPKFDPVFDEIYAPAIRNCGLKPLRSDLVLSAAGNVVDEIIHVMQTARIVIIDITGLNPNVLIELGLAQALRRPVILLTQDTQIPFDIQPKRVIRYDLSFTGKRRVKSDLQATLRMTVYPTENVLRNMFPLDADSKLLVVHGSASTTHMNSVFPPVDGAYQQRLFRYSSATSGMWDVAIALQKIALSRGLDAFRMDAVDAHRCDASVLSHGHIICLGGPGSNPLFDTVATAAADRFRNAATIQPFPQLDGRTRYRVTRGGEIFPADQDELLSQGTDFGILLRMRNPFAKQGMIWLVAGVRAYGTEGAIRALTTPSLISSMLDETPSAATREFCAVVRVTYDIDTAAVIDVVPEHTQTLQPHSAGG